MSGQRIVSVGLPVYNGAGYLREALDSILGQTWGNLELIVCDNASTDGTREICLEYAARDPRVRYTRSCENIGSAKNFNLTFSMARGPYFKWAAHDDVCAPRFIERCVGVLEREAGVVLCGTVAGSIGSSGMSDAHYSFPMRPDSPSPSTRFRDLIRVQHPCTLCFGVFRREALARTRLIGSYVGSDRNLLAEVALLGRIRELEECLFFQRQHGGRSIVACANPAQRLVWFDPSKARRVHLPVWRNLGEYARAVASARLGPAERARCLGALVGWAQQHRLLLLRDVWGAAAAMAQLAGLWRPPVSDWGRDVEAARGELARAVPPGMRVVLVDDNTWGVEGSVEGRSVLPFLERDGRYWGPPPDDGTAISELERLRRERDASFIAFAWHAVWWLDVFPAFGRHLRANYRRLAGLRRLVVFDLRPRGAAA